MGHSLGFMAVAKLSKLGATEVQFHELVFVGDVSN